MLDYLVVDLALHRLNKQVVAYLKELEKPQNLKETEKLDERLKRLVDMGKMKYEDYLILHTRVILNRFCYTVEEHVQNGVMTGFLFFSESTDKLYYGAGANYPKLIKRLLQKQTPTIEMRTQKHYKEDVFLIKSLDTWTEDARNFADTFRLTNFKSGASFRLRKGNTVLGTFEFYFPHENGVKDEHVAYIKKRLRPIIEELFEIRENTHILHDNIFTQIEATPR